MEVLLNLFWESDSDKPDDELLQYVCDQDKYLHCIIIDNHSEIGFVSAMVKDDVND